MSCPTRGFAVWKIRGCGNVFNEAIVTKEKSFGSYIVFGAVALLVGRLDRALQLQVVLLRVRRLVLARDLVVLLPAVHRGRRVRRVDGRRRRHLFFKLSADFSA